MKNDKLFAGLIAGTLLAAGAVTAFVLLKRSNEALDDSINRYAHALLDSAKARAKSLKNAKNVQSTSAAETFAEVPEPPSTDIFAE